MIDNKAPAKYYNPSNGELLSASQALYNGRYRLVPDGNGWKATELMLCDRPIFNTRHYGLLGAAPKRSLPDDDAPSEYDNLDRSRRRALKAMKDIMDCNRFDWFVTFTLAGDKINRTDYSAFVRAVNVYFKNRVQRHGWSYLAVPEYHKDGKALHLHALVKGDIKLVDSGTVIRPTGGRPVKLSTALKQGFALEQLKTVYNVCDWSLGWSTAIKTYGSPEALRRYVGKYITKSDDKIGGRWYFSGGELTRPLYVGCNVDFFSTVGDIEFEAPCGTFKIIYADRHDKSEVF